MWANPLIMTTVFLIDDHPLVADGIVSMLKTDSSVAITGVARTGEEALRMLASQAPDVILLDLNLPDTDGLQLCEQIRAGNAVSKIVILTSVTDAAIIAKAIANGANGYLIKDLERNDLFEAIDSVLNGNLFVSATANEQLLKSFRLDEKVIQHKILLTRREKEILALLEKGFNGPQIAQKLFLSTFTVETHRKNLMQKLGSSTTQMLLKKAKENKLTDE